MLHGTTVKMKTILLFNKSISPATLDIRSIPQFICSCVIKLSYDNFSIEVDAEAIESTRKTEEKLDGRNKEGHERKKPK